MDDIHGVQPETIQVIGVATREMVQSHCEAVSKLNEEIYILKSENSGMRYQLGYLITLKSDSFTSGVPFASYAAKASQRAHIKPLSRDKSSNRLPYIHRDKNSITAPFQPP